MRTILGVNLDDVPDQFNSAVLGRTLIIDGDGPAYVAAATAKRLDTAVNRYQQEILKRMFLAGAQSARIHLTASGSDKHGRFRVKATKPYQGNRTNKAKPSLLEPLREAIADHNTWLDEYSVIMHRELEADDGMIQDAYVFGENGVIQSEDKDLRMTPHPYWELDRGQIMQGQPVGFVNLKHTPSGTPKLAGQGPMFFWGQMLCGDTADHIQGVRRLNGALCGPSGAYGLIGQCKTIEHAANLVIDAYRAIDQNPLAEGWLLWLTRWPKDNVLTYFREQAMSDANAKFIDDCLHRDWVIPKEAADVGDTNAD